MRTLVLVLPLVALGCASITTPEASDVEFAGRLLAREDAAPMRVQADSAATAVTMAPLPARGRADAWKGMLNVSAQRLAELERSAADASALDALLADPLDEQDLEALAVLRSPTAREARERYEAARTSLAQSRDLEDLVGAFRSFTRGTETRVGPERSRRATAAIAPSPNVSSLSAEVAHRATDIAFEGWRAAVRDVAAAARRAHSDAANLHASRAIVREEVELDGLLLDVLQSRLEAGEGSLAGYLAFGARLEKLRTELAVLDERVRVVRAAWNELLDRPADTALGLDVVAPRQPDLPDGDDAAALVERALAARPEMRRARLTAERAALAVRLAETMTLPRMDVGSSRLERERAGEAGSQRGSVFPAPGRMSMPPYQFGVREAQVGEMRSRAAAADAARDRARDRTRVLVHEALFAVDAAARRVRVHDEEVVPLASRSLEAARGAYEANRAGYLDLLDAVRRLLDARLGLADARRDLAHARAALLVAVGEETTRSH